MKIYTDLNQNFYTGSEYFSGLFFKIRLQHQECRSPDYSFCLCDNLA